MKTRLLSFFCLLALTGCTPQMLCHIHVIFRNDCSYPVQVTAHYDSGYSNPTDQWLEPGKTITVVSTGFNDKKIWPNVQDTYVLDIRANGSQRTLDKEQFLKVIKKADDGDYWTINDPSLCPNPKPEIQ